MKKQLAIWVVVVLLIGLVSGWVWGQGTGLLGASMGLIAGAASFAGLWAIVRLMTGAAKLGGDQRWLGTGMMIFLVFLKISLLIGVSLVGTSLNDPGPSCFGMGLVLVYSAAVGWVASASQLANK
ncbi:MAG: hypothetical protein KDC26_00995 [Armatimonadetes bacterium]|nr:hypothetical protein [Armatimonadota bacterium]